MQTHHNDAMALVAPLSYATFAERYPLFAELIALHREAVAALDAQHPTYLDLPPVLARFANDACYLSQRASGRLFYREEMYVYVEETETCVYLPCTYSRVQVCELVYDSLLLPHERRLALVIPLAMRIGFLVGWLSALSVAQPDKAQEGMVILAALVAPLLSTPDDAPQLSGVQRATLRLAAARAEKGRRS